MELFTVSIKDGGVIGFEVNGDLGEYISLEELTELDRTIKTGVYPVAEAIAEIISRNIEKAGGITNDN